MSGFSKMEYVVAEHICIHIQERCGVGSVKIVRLKAENIALKRQQAELQEERDKLEKEVERSGDREYVQDQARKQLHLLNPGEILFTFEDEE